ncbi:hypothetical protein KPL71_026303 [Citrus sinensis]|uniref:Uncharacterized protein n=1 Tax=Citrus sinensis TaxID=2711 RepID=A0ACB8I058_CITSI|nr:hypothetical protein KPL71_026303 [Citrus sinensis]
MSTIDSRFEEFQAQIRGSVGVLSGLLRPSEPMSVFTEGSAGGTNFSLLLRSMKMDIPKFDGSDSTGWDFRINEFFYLHGTPDNLRLCIVSFHMEGRVATWYQWMKANNLLTTWRSFFVSLKSRFGASMYEDHQGNLSKLMQTFTAADFQSAFEDLMNKVTGISEPLLISFFITGLKLDIRRELLFTRPTSLMEAFALARAYKARSDEVKTTSRSCANHRCRSKFLLLMGTDDEECDPGEDMNVIEQTEEVVTADISSLNALAGHTHNFIKLKLAERVGLSIQSTSTFRVYIGNGDFLVCRFHCPDVPIVIQGHEFRLDFFVLPIEGPKVVLGIQWLQRLGRVSTDYSEMTMEFFWEGKQVLLRGDPIQLPNLISFNRFQALLHSEEVDTLFELHSLSSNTSESHIPNSTSLTFEIDLPTSLSESIYLLLHKYKAIPLSSVSKKNEMEKLVHEMLEQGIIKPSHSLFSSPVLLVRKKDGTYRFCVDYRAMNAGYATIAAPLTELLCKDVFRWNAAATEAFNKLKDAMVKASVLLLPNFELEFVIETDASNVGIGAVLMQVGHPIAYFSKKIGTLVAGIVDIHQKTTCHCVCRAKMETISPRQIFHHPQSSVANNTSHKLAKHYYWPFRVLERIGSVAYKLELPAGRKIHLVFHISLLKPYVGDSHVNINPLPPASVNNKTLSSPRAICAERSVLKQGKEFRQVFVQWSDCAPENSTWEDYDDFCKTYPELHLEDKVNSQGMGNDTTLPETNDKSALKTEEEAQLVEEPIKGHARMRRALIYLKDYIT